MKFYLIPVLFIGIYGAVQQNIEKDSFDYLEASSKIQKIWNVSSASTLAKIVEGLPKSLRYVGTSADGKSLFEESTLMSWQAGRDVCRSANLSLFFILSQHQKEAFPTADLDGEHWIGAREIRNINGFTWDNSQNNIPEFWDSFIDIGEASTPYFLCLSARKTSATNIHMSVRLCKDNLKVLCEL